MRAERVSRFGWLSVKVGAINYRAGDFHALAPERRDRCLIVAEILSSAQGGKLIENLARSIGLSTEQTRAAVEALTPALALGLRNAATNPAVLEQVVAGVVHPTHLAAFDDPAVAHGEEAGELGQAAVAQLFGSGSAAGQMAQIAARDAGLRPDILARLLPVLASVVLGGLFKSFNNQGLGSILGQIASGGGLGSILGQLGGATTAPPPAAAAERRRSRRTARRAARRRQAGRRRVARRIARRAARRRGSGARPAGRVKQACLADSIPRHCRRRSSKSRNP